MSTALVETSKAAAMELALVSGDLSKLSTEERLCYYKSVCDSVGLNPLTKPFEYITLNGKLTLYAKRDATDQLRKIHGVSVKIADRRTIEGVHVVTATATDKTGRVDESTGAVTIGNLKGDALANALMKAETKAKRRVTLSICGLGILDETELETISATTTPQQKPALVNRIANGNGSHPKPEDRGDAWEPPTAITEQTIEQVQKLLAALDCEWDTSTIERVAAVLKRQISPTEKLEHLSEEEGRKLIKPLMKALEQKAKAEAAAGITI